MFAIIFLANREIAREFFFGDEATVAVVRQYLADGAYTATTPIEIGVEGEHAAEEMFDLTNNPSRQNEREAKYGNGRSVSVGDIICLSTGEMYACMSIGWLKL